MEKKKKKKKKTYNNRICLRGRHHRSAKNGWAVREIIASVWQPYVAATKMAQTSVNISLKEKRLSDCLPISSAKEKSRHNGVRLAGGRLDGAVNWAME